MIEIKKVSTENFSMEYFTFGKGEKAFVILPGLSIQSVMGSAELIASAYEIIAREFTVYVFDRRLELPERYSVYDMANDTAKAFEALGIEDACVFGASQGGMIAMMMALKYPALVKKLMLGSTSAKITEKQYEEIESWVSLAKAGESEKLYVQQGRALYPESVFEQYKDTLASLGKSVTRDELNRFIVLAEGTRSFDVSNELNNISCPVFAIGSSDDKVLSGGTEQIASILADKPDFECFMYSSFGHAAFDTAPDYKERLLRFAKKP